MKTLGAGAAGKSDAQNEAARPYKSRTERRAEIVAATLEILTEEGLHAWTTAALADRLGVSQATLFRHFASKEEILSAAIRGQAEILRRRVAEYDAEGCGWDRLLGLVLEVIGVVEETNGGPLLILGGQASRIAPDVGQEIVAARDLLNSRLVELFREAAAERNGHLPHARLLAEMAIAVIHSTGLRWIMSGREYPMQRQAAAMLNVLGRCLEAQ
ncbi:MAG: TetR/AcrR family transcriptional regulator [Gemmatimonadota bacterium]|nr:MAG: TetR/AcrR family transcriptional regulator [Gemmatimonadota bacterium]